MPEYPQLICGIDPGASGGIALLGAGFVETHKMPETEDDVADLLRDLPIACAYMELVTPMGPRIDKVQFKEIRQGTASTWKFGQNYGMLRGILAALKIRREFVRPQEWQSNLKIPKRGEKSQTDHKNVLKARAQEIFPQVKVTHAIADALLIAEYGRRVHV